MSVPDLLDQLGSSERWTRYHAKRLLFDAPRDRVLKAASKWLQALSPQAPDYERLLLEAIGLFEAHEMPDAALLGKLLSASDPRVRAYGTRVIGNWADRLPDPLGLLRQSVHDSHPRVRLEAIVACSYVVHPAAVEVAVQALDSPRDPFIDYALTNTIRALRPQLSAALRENRLTFGGNAEHQSYVRKIAGDIPAVPHPGKIVYEMACLPCHQPDARGIPGTYPPLSESDWVRGNPTALIKLVLHGVTGPIEVAGKQFGSAPESVPMPAFGALDDQQIADVLSYVRSNFGNTVSPVTANEVGMVRSATKDRELPWTAAELLSGK